MRIYFFATLSLFCLSFNLNAQIFADFEGNNIGITLGGTDAKVVDNLDLQNNSSKRVLSYKKESGNWKAIYVTFDKKIDIKKNNTFSFLLRSSTQGRIFVKLWNGDLLLKEEWAPDYNFRPLANTWTQCDFDLRKFENQVFDRVEISASIDNEVEAIVAFDDFKLFNSFAPNGNPVAVVLDFKTKININETINFDASNSFDTDGEVVKYEWLFENSVIKTGNQVTYKFIQKGVSKLSLKITDNDGKTAVKNFAIYVLAANDKLSNIYWQTDFVTNSKIEGAFVVIPEFKNVYDPDEVSIDALITSPSNKTITVPCFYFVAGQVSQNRWSEDLSKQSWMLRFNTQEAGVYKIRLKLTDKNGVVSGEESEIIVSNSSNKGIINIAKENKQFYRHSTGEPYYPLGINAAWDVTSNYNKIIDILSNGGANLIRYWQVPFNKQALEWKNDGYTKGLGIYSQEAAAMQDSILNFCNQKNVNIQLVVFQHGMFSETVNSNWNDNPYNVALGGPLAQAEEFFYNETAKKSTKKLLRYIIARWGYSSNIFAWELFNEVQFTGAFPNQTLNWRASVLSWHDEMGKYIKSIDPFGHIVTTSADDNQLLEMDKLQGLDVLQYHVYNPNLLKTISDKNKNFKEKLTRTSIICGEYGLDVNTANTPFDVQRNAIWTGIMSQVPHFMWLWEDYLKPEWGMIFKIPSTFLGNYDFSKEGKLIDWPLSAKKENSILSSAGFQSEKRAYGIVYDEGNQSNLEGIKVDLNGLKSGNYDLKFINTTTGEEKTINKVPVISGISSEVIFPKFDKSIVFVASFNSDIDNSVAIINSISKVGLGESFLVDGRKSFLASKDKVTYIWDVVEKPLKSNLKIVSNSVEVSVLPDVFGSYTFGLKIKQGELESTQAFFKIYVSDNPIARAGEDIKIDARKEVELDGSKSSDSEQDALIFNWEIIKGPLNSRKVLSSSTQPKVTMFADLAGEYKIKLTVYDGLSNSKPDTITVIAKEVITSLETKENDSENNWVLYPNPTNDLVFIKNISKESTNIEVEIIDLKGKIVSKDSPLILKSINQTIGISLLDLHLKPGLYFLKIKSDEGEYIKKILFQ